MKKPIEQIENINDLDDFLSFLVKLAMNAKERPDEWENNTITDYLGQMASWMDDASISNDIIDWDNVDYKTLAKILYMGKIYE